MRSAASASSLKAGARPLWGALPHQQWALTVGPRDTTRPACDEWGRVVEGSGSQQQDLDMFVALARRFTPDEAERQLLRLNIPEDRVRAMRAAFDEQVKRIQELKDPPA